ncbi:MAG: hypothetical protein WA021_02440, partial [Minisyncoccia bacterium]
MQDTQQLERLYEEIQTAAKGDFDNGQGVKDFYGKISDFVNFIESNKSITKQIAKLKEDSIIKEIAADLIKEGEQILAGIRDIY